MRRWRLLLPLLLAGCAFPEMEEQPKYLPYRRNTFFDDNRAMLAPPPGTVPRDLRGRSRVLRTGRLAGGEYARDFPLPLTVDMVGRGQHAFEIYCATCHGVLGDGDSFVARNMALRPPPSLLDRDEPPGYFYSVVSEGFGIMPGYKDKLEPEARWAVVAYLRALQRSQRASLEDVPPEVRPLLQEAPP